MAVFALLVFVGSMLATAHVDPFDETIGHGYDYVVTDGIYGIIIDEAFVPRFINATDRDDGPHPLNGYWTPSAADVARAEDLLRSERGTDREADRKRAQERHADRLAVGGQAAVDDAVNRQYYGVVENGTRMLHVNAAFSGLPEDPLSPMIILDGGPGYWRATVDAERWTVESYVENGEA